MKIVVGGSVSFAKEELEIKQQLEKVGHTVYVSEDLEDYANNPSLKLSPAEELSLSLEKDVLRKFFNKISHSDAYLVCNLPKRNIDGYLGTSSLMELGVAYHLNKKIFLLNDIDRSQNYAIEIDILKPTVLNGDLSEVK